MNLGVNLQTRVRAWCSTRDCMNAVARQWADWRVCRHLCWLTSLFLLLRSWGTRWRSWFRHCATSRKVAGSIPDGVNGICHWQSFRPHYGTGVDSASDRNEYQEYFLGGGGVKAAGAWGCQPYHLHVPTVLKCGSLSLSLLEPSSPVKVSYGFAVLLRSFSVLSSPVFVPWLSERFVCCLCVVIVPYILMTLNCTRFKLSRRLCLEAFSRYQPSGHGIISQRIRDRVYSFQDRQCTYNVTLWRAGVTIVQRKHTTLLSVRVIIVEWRCYSKLYNMLSVAQQCVYGAFFAGNNTNFTFQFLT